MQLNDRKEEFSYSYVWAVSAMSGFVFELARVDRNSVDCRFRALDATLKRAPAIEVQMKCTADLNVNEDLVKFSLPVNNYDHLRAKVIVPRILIVVHVPNESKDWISFTDESRTELRHCAYWFNLRGLPPTSNTDEITVSTPRTTSRFNSAALLAMMEKANKRKPL